MRGSYRGIYASVAALVGLLCLALAIFLEVNKALVGFAVVRKLTIPILGFAIWAMFKDEKKIFGIAAVPLAIAVFLAPRFLALDDFHRIKGDWSNIHFICRTSKEIQEIEITQNGETKALSWLGEPKLLFAGLSFVDEKDSEFKIAVKFRNGERIKAQSVEREGNGEILRSTVVFIEDDELRFSVKYQND